MQMLQKNRVTVPPALRWFFKQIFKREYLQLNNHPASCLALAWTFSGDPTFEVKNLGSQVFKCSLLPGSPNPK